MVIPHEACLDASPRDMGRYPFALRRLDAAFPLTRQFEIIRTTLLRENADVE
jgi:hypothetical protein